MLVFLGIAALVLMALGMGQIMLRKGCSTEIQGVFVRYDRISAPKGGARYVPVFRYRIRAGECEWRALDSFAERARPDFVAGQAYSIWINAKKEKCFVVSRGIDVDGVGLLITGVLIGVVLIFVAIFGT